MLLTATTRKGRSKERQENWPRESSYAPCVLPAKTEDQRRRLCSAIDHWLLMLEEQKWPRAMQWFRNISFYTGNHYPNYRFNGVALDFNSPKHQGRGSADLDRLIPRTIHNKLIRPVEVHTGLLAERRPHPRVTPNSDQPEDEDAAKIAEIVFDLLWERELKGPEHLRQLALILCMTGTGSLETITEEGDEVVTVPMQKLVEAESRIFRGEKYDRWEPTGEVEEQRAKRIKLRVNSAFELLVDPCATNDPDSLQWIARQSYEDIDWIQEEFDRDGDGFHRDELELIAPNCGTTSPLYWHERCKDLLDMPESWYGLSTVPYGPGGTHSPNQTQFTVMDCRPNKWYPRGRTLIHAGGRLIYSGDARAWHERYPDRWHPHAIFRHWSVPGRFWGMPLLSHLVPLQKRINAIHSLMSINRQYMTIGQWLVPRQCKVPNGATSGYPGQDIPYNASSTGAKPERVQHEPLPAELWQELDRCDAGIDDIAGSRILSGDAQFGSGVRANLMLDFLRREALSSKGSVLQEHERGMEETAQNVLIEVSIGIGENEGMRRRILVAAREHSSLALEAFSGLSLRDHVHVKLDIASELLRSPEAEQESAQLWLQYRGQNMTPSEAAVLAKALKLEGFDRATLPQYSRARKMVARVFQGGRALGYALPIPTVDDPAIFAEVIRTAMLSDRMFDISEEQIAKFMELFQYYSAALEAQRNKALMQQVKAMEAMGGQQAQGQRR